MRKWNISQYMEDVGGGGKFFVAMLASLLLHGVVIFIITFHWKGTKEKRLKPMPKFVEAKLVDLKPKGKTKPSRKQKKPRIVDLTKKNKELENKKKKAAATARKNREAEKKAREEAEKKKVAERIAKKEKALEEARKKQQREQDLQQQLEDALLEEQEQPVVEEESAEQIQSVASLIKNRIIQKWSRPQSARNGMRCELSLDLVPNGTVVNVTITKGSGSDQFDRSAVSAVNKVGSFPEIKALPIDVFEKHFRKFSLGFQPEDRRL